MAGHIYNHDNHHDNYHDNYHDDDSFLESQQKVLKTYLAECMYGYNIYLSSCTVRGLATSGCIHIIIYKQKIIMLNRK